MVPAGAGTNFKMNAGRFRFSEWLVERAVFLAGALLVIAVGAMFYYLSHESKYAFNRTFTYGYRFALQPKVVKPDPYTGEVPTDLSLDPYSTLLSANREGEDGLGEREETSPATTLEAAKGATAFLLGTPVTTSEPGKAQDLYRDDFRAPRPAEHGNRFLLYASATPEHKEETTFLAWGPDAAYEPRLTPYEIRLRLIKAPAGIRAPSVDIDLRAQTHGRIELPTFVAKSDADRLNGYVFEMSAKPVTSSFFATLRNFFSTDWAPTLQYPRYGFVPLLLATMLIAAIALIIAVPIGIATAVYLSEIAPQRVREWLKPVIEMLASVPTVVLGYFGLMLVSPWLMKTVGEAIGMTSGRSMLTAALMMAFLLLPTIISLSEDALRSASQHLREGAEALGCTARESLRMVLLPAARAGLFAAVMLGFARGVGETMIVWILSGGTPGMPSLNPATTLASSTRGMADSIDIEMANVAFEEEHYGHLFLIGLCLFFIVLVINLAGSFIAKRRMANV